MEEIIFTGYWFYEIHMKRLDEAWVFASSIVPSNFLASR